MVKGLSTEWGTCSRTVSLNNYPLDLSYWNNTIAVGSDSGDIIILDAITGSQMAILSGHTKQINCLTFSSDGKSLVSGSNDATVKLWDVQTGGVVKTFHGDMDYFLSVSISADCTRIASGSDEDQIHLWDIQTGECYCTIEQDEVKYVSFSPTDPQNIISISGNEVWEWDPNGHQIPSTYSGSYIAFSPDHTQFALCNGNVITVQNSDSRAILAKFTVPNRTKHCCFSPDGQLIAAAAAYVWDITSPDPHLVETFVGHTKAISSLVFSSPSSLISASQDKSVRFWKIGASSAGPATTNLEPTPHTLSSIRSVSLQTSVGIAISSDADGVVKIWDISTGLCKTSFQTQATEATGLSHRDAQIIDGKLIFVWYKDDKIHIWDTGKGELLHILSTLWPRGLRMSGDGSKIICLHDGSIQTWSMWTWEPIDKVELELEGTVYLDSLCTDSSRVWVHTQDSLTQEGWDFGTPGSCPTPFDPSAGRPTLDFIGGTRQQTDSPSWIKDTITGKKVFQLAGNYAKPNDVQWDGRYLVAGYRSGDILILDFHHLLPQ